MIKDIIIDEEQRTKEVIYDNLSIRKAKFIYKNTMSWGDVIEQFITSYLKEKKIID